MAVARDMNQGDPQSTGRDTGNTNKFDRPVIRFKLTTGMEETRVPRTLHTRRKASEEDRGFPRGADETY